MDVAAIAVIENQIQELVVGATDDADLRLIREIVLGYFELFDKQSFTRQQVCTAVLADRDMPKVDQPSALVLEILDKLLVEGQIQSAGGEGKNEKFKWKAQTD